MLYDLNHKRKLVYALCIRHCTCTVILIKLSAGLNWGEQAGQRNTGNKVTSRNRKQGCEKLTGPIRHHLACRGKTSRRETTLTVFHRPRRPKWGGNNESERGVRQSGLMWRASLVTMSVCSHSVKHRRRRLFSLRFETGEVLFEPWEKTWRGF